MLKNLFVLRIGDFRPDLCEFTIPTIKHWCAKNGWVYNEITKRRYNDLPITAEKLQVHNLGKDSEWNILCDADLMLRPDFVDPVSFTAPNVVASSYHFRASDKFKTNIYFERDERDLGLSGGFVLTSKFTHDLWTPPALWTLALSATKNKHLIDEYVISTNLAKYGLCYDGVSNEPDRYIVHFGDADKTDEEKRQGALKAKELWLDWLHIWPSLGNQKHEPSSLSYSKA